MQHAEHKIFLHPGEFRFTNSGVHLHTVLGSCIAITLWHPRIRVGGMCHFVLPSRPYGVPGSSSELDGRYAPEAMQLFEQAADLYGVPLDQYQAKVFGGANVHAMEIEYPDYYVGTRNAEQAMSMLMERNIEILTMHVGETGNRRIVMDVSNGDVWVKHQQVDGCYHRSMNGRN